MRSWDFLSLISQDVMYATCNMLQHSYDRVSASVETLMSYVAVLLDTVHSGSIISGARLAQKRLHHGEAFRNLKNSTELKMSILVFLHTLRPCQQHMISMSLHYVCPAGGLTSIDWLNVIIRCC